MKFEKMSLSILKKWSVCSKQNTKILGMKESQNLRSSKVDGHTEISQAIQKDTQISVH